MSCHVSPFSAERGGGGGVAGVCHQGAVRLGHIARPQSGVGDSLEVGRHCLPLYIRRPSPDPPGRTHNQSVHGRVPRRPTDPLQPRPLRLRRPGHRRRHPGRLRRGGAAGPPLRPHALPQRPAHLQPNGPHESAQQRVPANVPAGGRARLGAAGGALPGRGLSLYVGACRHRPRARCARPQQLRSAHPRGLPGHAGVRRIPGLCRPVPPQSFALTPQPPARRVVSGAPRQLSRPAGVSSALCPRAFCVVPWVCDLCLGPSGYGAVPSGPCPVPRALCPVLYASCLVVCARASGTRPRGFVPLQGPGDTAYGTGHEVNGPGRGATAMGHKAQRMGRHIHCPHCFLMAPNR